MSRYIVSGKTNTELIQNIQFELGKVSQMAEGADALKKGLRVMATRTTSTVYLNGGSGPMWLGISLALSAPGTYGARLQIGAGYVARGDASANKYFFLMGIVNPGEQYILTATGGANIGYWMEYGF